MTWYWSSGGIHWWGWLLTSIVTVAFWALVIWAIVFAVRTISHGGHAHQSPERPAEHAEDSPEQTLARRFANGEIEEEEFHRRLDALRKARSS